MATIEMLGFVAIGLIPSFAWLVFFLREDLRHPEPKRLIALAFFAGVAVTFAVLAVQLGIRELGDILKIAPYGITAFVLLSLVEEAAKFGAAYWVVSRHRKDFDEPVDAMIYMMVAALGLAAVENVALVLQSQAASLFEPGPLEVTALRFMGATLLHALASGIVGFHWGRAAFRGMGVRRAVVAGIAIATVLHAAFNWLILRSEPVTLPLILLIFAAVGVLYDFEKLKRPVTMVTVD